MGTLVWAASATGLSSCGVNNGRIRYKLLGKCGSAMGSNDDEAASCPFSGFSRWAARSLRTNVNSCRVFAA
jgi:hypothetical protein